MKIIITLALVSFFGAAASAQDNSASVQPSQPAVTIPAQPTVSPAQTEPALTIDMLRKKHIDAGAELKKKHIDEIKALRESLKGKPQAERRKAIEAKKAENKAAVKELKKSNKAEIVQFRKDHPKMMNKAGKTKTDPK